MAKITIKEALHYCSVHTGSKARQEFARRVQMNGKEILTLGVSHEQNWPGFPNAPRSYRIEIFVDGKHKQGMIV